MNLTRLDEPAEYAKRREELRQAEVELMQQREKVAALRRELPPGAAIEDYEFLEGPRDLSSGDEPVTSVRLSELFTSPERALVVQHVMYGKRQSSPCPMCTLWIDGLNGVVRHIEQHADFVVAAAADPATLRAHARHRGWDNVRLLSCGGNTFQYDLARRRRGGRAGLDHLGLHARRRRFPPTLLQCPPPNGRRHPRARHRPVVAPVASLGPHATGTRAVVRRPGLLTCRSSGPPTCWQESRFRGGPAGSSTPRP